MELAASFCVGRYAVTRGQFAAFVNATNYKAVGDQSWREPGFDQDDDHPVVCVSWNDARAYAAWLSEVTEQTYGLLSEAEWEYVVRAGTTTPFWWGSSITPAQANYDGSKVYKGGGSQGEARGSTVAAGSFEANPWGLYNVHGNVWEWGGYSWHDSLIGPAARVRGGAWDSPPELLRAAIRSRGSAEEGLNSIGFRLGRSLSF